MVVDFRVIDMALKLAGVLDVNAGVIDATLKLGEVSSFEVGVVSLVSELLGAFSFNTGVFAMLSDTLEVLETGFLSLDLVDKLVAVPENGDTWVVIL